MRYVPDLIVRLFDHAPVWSRSVFSTGYGLLKNSREGGRQFQDYMKELRETQWWPVSQLEELQSDRLRRLIQHAATTVPYYGRVFAEYGIAASQIQSRDDLKKLPTLSKDTVRRERNSLIAKTYRLRDLRPESTSGTTGTPLTVFMNREAYLYAKAAQWLHHEWAGYTHQEWLGVLAGYNVISMTRRKPPFWATNFAGRQVHFSTRHLKPDYFSAFVDRLRSSRIEFLLGYPSAISLLARHITATGDHVPLRAVFLSSETLYGWEIEAIRAAFGCPVFNYYGQAERAVTATSCGSSLEMHLNMEMSLAEYEGNGAGENRVRIVGTSLMNYGMPLIRYELHDFTSRCSGPCPCGRQHDRIGPVETLVDDYLVGADGALISPSLAYLPFQRVRGIISSQLVQEEVGRITVNVVVNELFTKGEESTLRNELVSAVGAGTEFAMQRMESIPLTANGKFRFVISRVSHDMSRGPNGVT